MLPLFDAARNGHTEIVALLLEHRADVNLADSVSCHSACPLQAQEVHGAGAAPDERAAAGAVAFREAAPKQAALAPNVQTCAVHGRGTLRYAGGQHGADGSGRVGKHGGCEDATGARR